MVTFETLNMLREFKAVFFKPLAHLPRKDELTANESRHRLGSSQAHCPSSLRSFEAAIF